MVKIREFEIVGKGGDIDISNMTANYSPVMKTITYKGIANSAVSGSHYPVTVQVLRVNPEDIVMKENVPFLKSEDILDTKDVKVDCNCKQYVMGGCLKGNIEHNCNIYTDKELTSYKRTTDNPNLAKNVDKNPQLCKHLAGFIKQIINNFVLH